MQVCEFLSDHRVTFETLLHPPAFTSQKRAKFLGVSGKQVAKGVLLVGPHGYFVAVLPATHRVDTQALGRHLHGAVRLAQAEEIAAVFCDCEWGVVPPFGRLYGLPTVVDETLTANGELVVLANRLGQAIRMRCRDFERLEQPQRLCFARRASTCAAPASE
ncbi:MAG: aminoacyl-tRNA deacylase [Gemmataceae bacterium]